MASRNWGTNRPLVDLLFDEAYRFEFYQAMRLLERLRPESVAVGEGSNPAVEVARFKSRVSMSFPASDIDSIKPGKDGGPPEMAVNFMGLAGAFGPMPNPYVELLIERETRGDTTFRDFLDLFNHRLLSIMYRIRKVSRVGMEIKSPDQVPFANYLYALMGLGTRGLRDRMDVRDRAWLYYTGLMTQKPHSILGLERVLSHYFGVTVKGRQFRGRWQPLERDQWTIIGAQGQNQVLGESAVLGTRAWDQQTKFTLVVGPLKLKDFEEFLPAGSRFQPVVEMTRFYTGRELDFEINLVIKALEVPPAVLSAKSGPRLGWTSWIRTKASTKDDNQVILAVR
jgi:type VI secretion system protein ImpH